MRYRLVLPSLLTLSALGLAACGEETTQPNPPADQVPTAAEAVVTSNTWIKRADMLTSRTDLAVATVTNAAGQSVVYAMGGRNWNGVPIAVNAAYNVATNTWTFRRGLPVGLANSNGAGVINGKIYVSGGFRDWSSQNLSQALYMYDPAANTWTRKHNMPWFWNQYQDIKFLFGAQGATGVIGGKLYVVTPCFIYMDKYGLMEGCPGRGPGFFRYNPVTDQWSSLPSPWDGTALSPYMGGVIGGKFYILGKSGVNATKAWFAVYDPGTNRWTPKTPLDLSRPGAATAVLQSKLYVIGGSRYNFVHHAWEAVAWNSVYNPITNAWTQRVSLPSPRTGIAGSIVFVNGQPRIEVVGGNIPGNNLQYIP